MYPHPQSTHLFRFPLALIVLSIVLVAAGGCTDRRGGAVVYQNSTIESLLEGNYDGDVTFAQLREHGDFGLGTFDALDGEMLAIRGRFYQIRSDGRVSVVPETALTPFSVVTFFRPSATAPLNAGPMTYKQLEARLDSMRPGDGRAYAFALEGRFEFVRTRSVPRQSPPYRRLVEVVKEQSVFNLKNVSGMLVGFWFPESMRGANVPGYHFHFLTSDHSAGGHVLDLSIRDGTVQMMQLSTVEIALPHRAPATRPAFAQPGELEAVEK